MKAVLIVSLLALSQVSFAEDRPNLSVAGTVSCNVQEVSAIDAIHQLKYTLTGNAVKDSKDWYCDSYTSAIRENLRNPRLSPRYSIDVQVCPTNQPGKPRVFVNLYKSTLFAKNPATGKDIVMGAPGYAVLNEGYHMSAYSQPGELQVSAALNPADFILMVECTLTSGASSAK